MIYILTLIVAMNFGQGTTSLAVEYSSKEACDVAREAHRYQLAQSPAKNTLVIATCTAKALK